MEEAFGIGKTTIKTQVMAKFSLLENQLERRLNQMENHQEVFKNIYDEKLELMQSQVNNVLKIQNEAVEQEREMKSMIDRFGEALNEGMLDRKVAEAELRKGFSTTQNDHKMDIDLLSHRVNEEKEMIQKFKGEVAGSEAAIAKSDYRMTQLEKRLEEFMAENAFLSATESHSTTQILLADFRSTIEKLESKVCNDLQKRVDFNSSSLNEVEDFKAKQMNKN